METIRWGIIGCGDVTEKKSGPAFSNLPGSKLTCVMRRDGDKAADYAQRHNVPHWTTNAQELIESPEVDAVYIATPPGARVNYAEAVAKVGKPIYLEKPMAATGDQCDDMIELCARAKVPLYVAYYRRALPRFLKVKELLAEKAIGEIRAVSIKLLQPRRQGKDFTDGLPWRFQKEHSGGGLFIDLGAHQLDLLDYLLGPVESAHGHAVNQAGDYEVEDALTASFLFPKNVVGHGLWCFTSSVKGMEENITIEGAHGRIHFSCFGDTNPGQFTQGPSGARVSVGLERDGRLEEFAIPHPATIQEPLIATVLDDLRDTGECPSTGETAARTTRLMEALVENYPYRP